MEKNRLKFTSLITSALLCAIMGSCISSPHSDEDSDSIIVLEDGWKFNTEDEFRWAEPDFDDSSWNNIMVDRFYELQGWRDYNGYSWYRLQFTLPSSLKEAGINNDSIRLFLGMIDDHDVTYLNGRIIGMDAKNVPAEFDTTGFSAPRPSLYNINRTYTLPVEDERLYWGQENLIAIRVYDPNFAGGIYGNIPPSISMFDLRDMLSFDLKSTPFQFSNEGLEKMVSLENTSAGKNFKGDLVIKVQSLVDGTFLFEETENIELKAGEISEHSFSFQMPANEPCMAFYSFVDAASQRKYEESQEVPYILTPEPSPLPRITGARIFGARPGNPLIYRISATGEKPVKFTSEGLPDGLKLDSNTGNITGSVTTPGTYITRVTAANHKGEASRSFKIVIGDQLALTPPMGWNSWNCWGLSVDDQKVRQVADDMISTGLADHGWTYINIDDGWEAPKRLADGSITPNEKFPDMKKLGDYIHEKGFKFGIYSGPGDKTCGGYLASYQHELQDAKTWASWGVDYIKYDWCTYTRISGPDPDIQTLKKPFALLESSLLQLNRDMVFCICPHGLNGARWEWCPEVGGNLWRNTFDITDDWASMTSNGFNQADCLPVSEPGHWNDPDMMLIGWVGWGPSLHPTQLTVNEQYTHVSLWCLLSAPLLLGTEIGRLDKFSLSLLSNDEVLDVDQDPLGKPAKCILKKDKVEIWAKELEDGSKVVGLFNRGRTTQKITLHWADLQIEGRNVVRDLWRQIDMGVFENSFEAEIFPHGVVLVKLMENE